MFLLTDAPTTEIYTLSLHDALPILARLLPELAFAGNSRRPMDDERRSNAAFVIEMRSEEHTSELQSRGHLVCRLLLEKQNLSLLLCHPVPGLCRLKPRRPVLRHLFN